MHLSGNWLVAQRLVTTILYKLLRPVFITVQRIYWQLNGTAQKLRETRLPRNYERSAQVLDVLICHKFSHEYITTLHHFIYTHNRFEDPQYIIDNDNITLLTINDHDAVFCETEEKGKHQYTQLQPMEHSYKLNALTKKQCYLLKYCKVCWLIRSVSEKIHPFYMWYLWRMSCGFANYRAKRNVALLPWLVVRLSVRPSVCPSVTLVDCDHTRWNSSKITSRMISIGTWLSADPKSRIYSKGNTPKF